MPQDSTSDLEVFVLGAGFSRAFNAAAPLMAKFLSRHVSLLANGEEFDGVGDFLRRCGFVDPAEVNIETAMTLARISKPWAPAEDVASFSLVSHQLKRLVLKIIDESFARDWKPAKKYPNPRKRHFRWYQLGTRKLDDLRCFAAYLLEGQGRSQIITFNYDVLLENAIELAQAEKYGSTDRFHAGRSYGFHALKWTSDGAIEPMERRPKHTDFHVLKLHGCVKWLPRKTSGLPVFPNDILVLSAHEDTFSENPSAQAVIDAEFERTPFIVPPLLDKTALLENPVLNVIWTRAASYVQRARRLVFIGYSFPPTDFAAEVLFRFHTSQTCRVEVVDLQPNERRYRDIFGHLPDVSFICEDAADFCGRLRLAQ